jgi:cytochrome c biogenesis protein CcmG/thiol:disulfide interchange protein DsbE
VALRTLEPVLPILAAQSMKHRPSPRAAALGGASLLALLVVGQGACVAGTGGPAVSAPSSTGGLVGNPAPDFSVSSVAGARGAVSLKQLHGKVVLVDFWGTFCTPCKSSFPKLQALNAKYAGSGLEIVGISEDEAEDKAKIPAFANTYGAKFAIGWDEDRSISQRYQPETMPSSFLIDKKGIVRFAHVGYRNGDEVQIEKEIQDLLAR